MGNWVYFQVYHLYLQFWDRYSAICFLQIYESYVGFSIALHSFFHCNFWCENIIHSGTPGFKFCLLELFFMSCSIRFLSTFESSRIRATTTDKWSCASQVFRIANVFHQFWNKITFLHVFHQFSEEITLLYFWYFANSF